MIQQPNKIAYIMMADTPLSDVMAIKCELSEEALRNIRAIHDLMAGKPVKRFAIDLRVSAGCMLDGEACDVLEIEIETTGSARFVCREVEGENKALSKRFALCELLDSSDGNAIFLGFDHPDDRVMLNLAHQKAKRLGLAA